MSLFVTSQFDKTIREFDSTTGAFIKVVAAGALSSTHVELRNRW